jgi:geranylgeranyl diphosphate synthase type I
VVGSTDPSGCHARAVPPFGILDAMEASARDGVDPAELRRRVDEVLDGALRRARDDVAARSERSADLVDEVARLVGAGGKRIRPILCVLGSVAAAGPVEEVLPAAAGIELFHTFALVHDDVMDDEDERRGVVSTHRRFATDRPGGEAFGRSVAILVGDLAFALGVDLILSTPLPPDRVLAAARRLRPMALATAAGQYLDVRGDRDPAVASLKTAVYTAEVPLAVGAELAGAPDEVHAALAAFAEPVGVAFQLLDDAADEPGDQAPAYAAEAGRLLDRADEVLASAPIAPAAAAALGSIVAMLRGAA